MTDSRTAAIAHRDARRRRGRLYLLHLGFHRRTQGCRRFASQRPAQRPPLHEHAAIRTGRPTEPRPESELQRHGFHPVRRTAERRHRGSVRSSGRRARRRCLTGFATHRSRCFMPFRRSFACSRTQSVGFRNYAWSGSKVIEFRGSTLRTSTPTVRRRARWSTDWAPPSADWFANTSSTRGPPSIPPNRYQSATPFRTLKCASWTRAAATSRPTASGEIVVESRYLATGYWRDPGLTGQRFETSATVCVATERAILVVSSRTACLIHLGRLDQRVRIAGEFVDTAEIERLLTVVGGIRQAVVRDYVDRAQRTPAVCLYRAQTR